jgi:hypothetical protein
MENGKQEQALDSTTRVGCATSTERPLAVSSPPVAPGTADGASFSTPQTLSEATLRECLIQASNNARAYMDLRFKHFGTFVLMTGLLGGAAFRVEELSNVQASLAGASLVLTVLFWLLDFRTSQYFSDELHRIRVFKQLLAVPPTNCPKHLVLLRASHATNLIFLATLVLWGIIFTELPVTVSKAYHMPQARLNLR